MKQSKIQIDSKNVKVIILLLLCVILSLLNKSFLSVSNIMNILRQASVLIILGLGMTMVVITRGIDLSIAGMMSLAACLCGTMLNKNLPISLAILITVCCGAAFGFINGLLLSFVGLPPFVATYGMSFIANGLALVLMNGNILYGFPRKFLFLGTGFIFAKIPFMVVESFFLALLFQFLLSKTVFGKEVYCAGANSRTSYISGINTTRTLLVVFTLSGTCAAIAGVLQAARMNAAQAGIGDQFQMLTVAAVVMGGTSMAGGEGGIPGTIIGAIILTLIVNGMNLLEVPSNAQSLITGFVIIVSVILDMKVKKNEAIKNGGAA